MKLIFKLAAAVALITPILSYADLTGTYLVSGTVLKPTFAQCYAGLKIEVKDGDLIVQAFTCSKFSFSEINAHIDGDPKVGLGARLRNDSGQLVGVLTENRLSYQDAQRTVGISFTPEGQGGLNYSSTDGSMFNGQLSRRK